MGEFAADRCSDLCHLLGRAEPVEPCQQRRVQAGGDGQRGRWDRGGGPPRLVFGIRLKHGLRHFLDEQRNAVRALDDVLPDVCRDVPHADDAIDHGADLVWWQPVDRERRHVRPSGPWRHEFRPRRHDQQHGQRCDPINHPTERLKAGRIDPMCILEDHEHRTGAGQRVDPGDERIHRPLPALLRGEVGRAIASVVRNRQHLGKQCDVLRRGGRLREQGVELVESCSRRVFRGHAGGAFHLDGERIKCAVRVLRRAEIARARVRLGRKTFHERSGQPRFADAGFAREQHHLAFAAPCQGPAPRQQPGLFVPSDQRRQATRMQGVEAAFHRAEAQRRPGPCRLGNAFELLRAEIAQIEELADKPSRAFGDDHHVGLGDALQARRQIGRFADDAALLRSRLSQPGRPRRRRRSRCRSGFAVRHAS